MSEFVDKIKKCLSDIEIAENYSKKLVLLRRLIVECTPNFQTVNRCQHMVQFANNRFKNSEKVRDKISEIAERLLCDEPTKNDMIKGLEEILKECGYDGGLI